MRTLASKSTPAAKNNNLLIQQSVTAVNESVKVIRDTSAAINELGNCASEIKKIIDVIDVSSGEQAKMIGQISKSEKHFPREISK